jgi:hypothetical protein
MTKHSHTRKNPSDKKYNTNNIAQMKNTKSRKNDSLQTLNGRTNAMDPVTTAVIRLAAPINSPIARDPLPILTDEYVLNKSGDPLPNAKKVTPNNDSDNPKILPIVFKFGHRNSEAAMPIVMNILSNHNDINIQNAITELLPDEQ